MMIIKHSERISFDFSYSPPPDKSISHRSIFFSALTPDNIMIKNFLFSDDCFRTIEAFRSLGVKIEIKENKNVLVSGVGLNGLKAPSHPIYLGNSGTSARLLIGLLSAQNFESTLTGDDSLSCRPMKRVTQPLRLMGAKIEGREDANYLPVKIRGGRLKSIKYRLPIASAQVKSALLIAGLYARGKTIIEEPFKSRDHTERILKAFGAKIKIQGLKVEIQLSKLSGKDISLPGDISSSAYFITLCLLSSDSRLIVKNVGLNPTRLGFIDVLRRMGARIEFVYKIKEEESEIFEPCGDIIVLSSDLKGTKVYKHEIPKLIDELPILFLLASLAKGETYIEGAEELRVKETDRINSMFRNLNNMGAKIKVKNDDIMITGVKKLKSAQLMSFSDHRTAMAALISAIFACGSSTLDDIDCIKISYPDFLNDLKNVLGSQVEFVI